MKEWLLFLKAADAAAPLPRVHHFVAHSHTPRTRCVRFVFGVTAASRNTRFQAARQALPGRDLHRLIAPALLAAFHYSITSSARASRVGGTSMPSARAVGRLMTSSNLLDCTTGKSTGLAPLRMRPE